MRHPTLDQTGKDDMYSTSTIPQGRRAIVQRTARKFAHQPAACMSLIIRPIPRLFRSINSPHHNHHVRTHVQSNLGTPCTMVRQRVQQQHRRTVLLAQHMHAWAGIFEREMQHAVEWGAVAQHTTREGNVRDMWAARSISLE